MNVLEIKGGIGGWYADAEYFDYKLKQFDNQDIEVHIDSLGGSFIDAISMYHSLKKYKGKTTAIYTGLCASAATIVAAGCEIIKMTDASAILIHKVLNFIDLYGYLNSDDIDKAIENLNKTKKELDTLSSLAASIYAKKAGKSIEEMLAIMKEDSWILAEDAEKIGLIDDVVETQEAKKAEQKIEDLIENKRQAAELINNVVLPKFDKKTKTKKNMTILDKVKNFFNSNNLDTSKVNELVNELEEDYKNELEDIKTELAELKSAFAILKSEVEEMKNKKDDEETIESKEEDDEEIMNSKDIEKEIENVITQKTASFADLINELKTGNQRFLNDLKQEMEKEIETRVKNKVEQKISEIHLDVTNKVKDGRLNGNPSFVEPTKTIDDPFVALSNMFS